MRLRRIAIAALVVACVWIVPQAVAARPAKLRADLAAEVYGPAKPDARVMRRIAGHRPGELAYFVRVRGSATAARAATLRHLGARILDRYGIVPAFAVASRRSTVLRIAALRWATELQPVQLVHEQAAEETLADQTRGSPADIGAPTLWNSGVTGTGVKIAVIDTGIDPTHPDLTELDFRHWSQPAPPKVVGEENFTNGQCTPDVIDGHGHGTHVAGIAAGTGEGSMLDGDSHNGKYAGVAPGAWLGVAKAIDDTGNGANSDLLKAMEWAASPPTVMVSCGTGGLVHVPGLGADIVNMSLGSDSRPARLNSSNDADLVGAMLDALAARYGTLFVAAVGNDGPYLGSALESPGSASQALSVGASAKDYDVNHDGTYSGDTCAGWLHPNATCSPNPGTQPPSLSALSSRGPTGDLWLKPDVVAPGYNIVAPQAATGSAIATNDLNLGTRTDPLYATASGTSMAAPTVSGAAALLLQAYRAAYGTNPTGASGLAGIPAPRYALLRAALMNTAGSDLYEARWILTRDASDPLDCSIFFDPLLPIFCSLGRVAIDSMTGSTTLYEVRNGPGDPYVGPLGEGAGKINVPRAAAALVGGAVMYSTSSGSGTGPRDLQGSWQAGAVTAGANVSQKFVVHAAPHAGKLTLRFSFTGGHPSDESGAITSPWKIGGPGSVDVQPGTDKVVAFNLEVPGSAAPGSYTGALLATVSNGQTLRLPIYASVALHDPNTAAGNQPGPQAKVDSARDVYAKSNTSWPIVSPGTLGGAQSDWLDYPVQLGAHLTRATFTVWDTAAGTDTYDLYLYDSNMNLEASTHPFDSPGVSDPSALTGRPASTAAAPQTLTVSAPAAGRHYLVVSRAFISAACPCTGNFGSFSLRLDETTKP